MSHAQNTDSPSECPDFGLQKRSFVTIYRWSPLECCWSVEVASRAYWKGYLKLSLVSCPIALSPATSDAAKVSFRQINKKTGNRLRYQHVDDETREPVDSDDRGKGYEVAKGVYIPARTRSWRRSR